MAEQYVPKMTSNNTPVPFEVSASSTYGTTLLPFKAFNRDVTVNNAWCSEKGVNENNPAWLQIKLDKAIVLESYGIVPYFAESGKLSYPMSFSLRGSNDGNTWITLDIQTNVENWGSEEKSFSITSTDSFQYYQINITKAGRNNAGVFDYAYVNEFNLYERAEIRKYLIQGPDNVLYTLMNETLITLGDQELSSQRLLDSGMDSPPNGSWIAGLPNAKVLCWSDFQDKPPKIQANVTALPLPQEMVVVADMTHESISGIRLLSVNYSGQIGVRYSTDGNSYTEEMSMEEFLATDVATLWESVQPGRMLYMIFVLHGDAALTTFQISYNNYGG